MLSVFLAPARVLPDSLHSCALARIINHLLRGQPVQARLAELDGKVVALGVDDLSIELRFCIRGDRLVASPGAPSHVSIRGRSEAFAALLLRHEDPDTLFFQRRLSVEGETETGVHIKNLIDGFDYDLPGHFHAVLPTPIASLLTRLVTKVRSLPHAAPMPGRPRQ